MKRDRMKKADRILYGLGLLPVIWAAFLAAPILGSGLPAFLSGFPEAFSHPFRIVFCPDTAKTVLIFLAAFSLFVLIRLSAAGNYRPEEEHGSAKWGSPKTLGKKYGNREHPDESKILTENTAISLNGAEHRRNLNVMVIGGSGAGKTRYYAKPNVMQACSSMVILDPKGEIISSTGNLLRKKGYDVKVIDLISMEKSNCYNPFVYIREDNDILKLVTNLYKNTTPKGARSQDPFWDDCSMMLLLALMFYLYYEAPPEEQNFPMIMEMIRAGEVREDDENYRSPLDRLFSALELRDPDHIAVRYYKNYRRGAGKTLKSIQITLVSRLEKFNLDSLAGITCTDDLELGGLGERKTALFAVIPDNDTSFNFIIGMLYTQLFQQLYYSADKVHNGSLPVHVHFLMDEFPNVALPDGFDTILSTMRSRGISVSIILQNLSQLKKLFEKEWESIVGNCDEFLYLGGNEQGTYEYLSKRLGKETIDLNTYGDTSGARGSHTTNRQLTGRDLMTPDEIGRLDNALALLFVRGERPVLDRKYDILKHPNISFTSDGGAQSYVHGTASSAIASLRFGPFLPAPSEKAGAGDSTADDGEKESSLIVLCEEEISQYLCDTEKEAENEKTEYLVGEKRRT